ncbi:MAG: hypothetical protein HGA85_04880 [Nanoarchaeota archaeon]|nr:hypothetical protein [Nanoarchaeota archaeon]
MKISMVNPSQYFRLANGVMIKNISELPGALEKMDRATFSKHVTSARNDFAKWIFEVYSEQKLSDMIGPIKDKGIMARTISAYILTSSNTGSVGGKSAQVQANMPQAATKPAVIPAAKSDMSSADKASLQAGSQGSPQPVQNMTTLPPILKKPAAPEQRKNELTPDQFFKENPIIIENRIEAKKESLVREHLEMLSIKDDGAIEKQAELFKDTYAKVYQQMAFLRKNGFDTKLCELMVARIPARIKLFETTHDIKDALTLQRMINEAIDEMNAMR